MQKKGVNVLINSILSKTKRKGLSTIVITLIIILISLVAVGIIWVVVRNVIQKGADQLALGQFTLDAKITDVTTQNTSNNVTLTVRRNAGEGAFTKINFVFSDGKQSEVLTELVSLKELEERRFILHLSLLNVSKLISISIVPILNQDGNEILGNVLDKYTVSGGTGQTLSVGSCTPFAGCGALSYVCGNWTNGTCSSGQFTNCGDCGVQTCNSSGRCVASCAPTTCLASGYQCGAPANGTCAGNLNCGPTTCDSYGAGYICNASYKCVLNMSGIIGNFRYVRQGATGANNGSDWTNAYTTLPATLLRNYTYYIADGNYSGYTFDDAVSGTQYITIKKAILSDHGTDTGWQLSYSNPSTWTGWEVWKITGDYYYIEGNSLNSFILEGQYQEHSSYGFLIVNGNYNIIKNVKVQHVNDSYAIIIQGSYNEVSHNLLYNNYKCDSFRIWGRNNVISYNEVDESASPPDPNPSGGNHADFFQTFGDNCPGCVSENITIEYNYLHDSPSYQPFHLTSDASDKISNWTFRNNIFANVGGAGFTYLPYTFFYNNIFYNVGTGPGYSFYIRAITNQPGLYGPADHCRVYNNVFVSTENSGYIYDTITRQTMSMGNNFFTKTPGYLLMSNAPNDPDSINGGNPQFVNIGNDFSLQSSSPLINKGYTLSIGFEDMVGVSRPQGSAWDIGAYEYL